MGSRCCKHFNRSPAARGGMCNSKACQEFELGPAMGSIRYLSWRASHQSCPRAHSGTKVNPMGCRQLVRVIRDTLIGPGFQRDPLFARGLCGANLWGESGSPITSASSSSFLTSICREAGIARTVRKPTFPICYVGSRIVVKWNNTTLNTCNIEKPCLM